jgi:uroporphyrin-3 C-methyltransferase
MKKPNKIANYKTKTPETEGNPSQATRGTETQTTVKDSTVKESPKTNSTTVKNTETVTEKAAVQTKKPDADQPEKNNKSIDKPAKANPEKPIAEAKKIQPNAPKAQKKPVNQSSEPDLEKPNNKSAKLALVISIIALTVVGFQYYQTQLSGNSELQNARATIDNLQKELSAGVAAANANANSIKVETDASISKATATLNQVNANLLKLQASESQKSDDISALQDRLTKSIQQVEASGLKQNSRKDWLLAEVEYLLRLANQRVLMENTPIGALALLKSADDILHKTDDVSIFSVRKALAADITALAAVTHIDQEGIYLQIDALSGQINQLKLVPITDKKQLPQIINEVATDVAKEVSESTLSKVWSNASAKLEKLVVISNRDSAIDPLLSPAQQAGLLQNLHILFEQTQLALLQRKQIAYQRSIEKAELIINRYFQREDGTTQGLLKGLTELKKQQVSVDLPSIAGSLNALKSYLKQSTEIKAGAAG